MRVIGADIQSSDICWIMLEGTADVGGINVPIEPRKHPLPTAGKEQVDNLVHLQQTLRAALIAAKPDLLAIIRADIGCSPERIKIECVLQFAAKDVGVQSVLIAPQTVTWAEKSTVRKKTGATIEALFFNKQPINPKYLTRAAYCAWSAMNA